MLDRAIVNAFCLLILISFVVSMTGIVSDLTRKTEFDGICRQMLYEIDLHGRMTNEKANYLSDALEQKGYRNINITCTGDFHYGKRITFRVEAVFDSTGWTDIFKFAGKERLFVYEREIVSRKIYNLAQ